MKEEQHSNIYIGRTICEVLQEMRSCNKTRNYAALRGLIEEAQIMGNNMESALYMQKDLTQLMKDLKKLKKKYNKLVDKYNKRKKK